MWTKPASLQNYTPSNYEDMNYYDTFNYYTLLQRSPPTLFGPITYLWYKEARSLKCSCSQSNQRIPRLTPSKWIRNRNKLNVWTLLLNHLSSRDDNFFFVTKITRIWEREKHSCNKWVGKQNSHFCELRNQGYCRREKRWMCVVACFFNGYILPKNEIKHKLKWILIAKNWKKI
jgi:hypothetical protein